MFPKYSWGFKSVSLPCSVSCLHRMSLAKSLTGTFAAGLGIKTRSLNTRSASSKYLASCA